MKAATLSVPMLDCLAYISIHAAREGGDMDGCIFAMDDMISIHAAREGGDQGRRQDMMEQHISIHAAREGGDYTMLFLYNIMAISIHAAREGGDGLSGYFALLCLEFQSTPPVKAATKVLKCCKKYCRFQSTPPVKAATAQPQGWRSKA